MSTAMNVLRQMRGPDGQPVEVAPDVACLRVLMVNVCLVGKPGSGDGWVLVDAGLPFSAQHIIDAADARFGHGSRPAAIILTHGHFDHVGALGALIEHYDVPVYAHSEEMPYLTGERSYPPPDPTVGGGLMSRLSPLYPRGPIDIHSHLHELPSDGTVPHLPGWRWIHTPGHTPGHVSLYREADRTLIAGDAFCCTAQESALAVLTQYKAIHGPPAYYTVDWDAAWESVRTLASLEPAAAATGHGLPMVGPRLQRGLHDLAAAFDVRAIPAEGRYADRAAASRRRPPVADASTAAIAAGVLAAAVMAALAVRRRSSTPTARLEY